MSRVTDAVRYGYGRLCLIWVVTCASIGGMRLPAVSGHGTTASDASIDDERHPEMRPRSPMELARKMRAEAAEGRTPVDAAKRLLEEVDRDLSGEYERRDEEEAVRRRR